MQGTALPSPCSDGGLRGEPLLRDRCVPLSAGDVCHPPLLEGLRPGVVGPGVGALGRGGAEAGRCSPFFGEAEQLSGHRLCPGAQDRPQWEWSQRSLSGPPCARPPMGFPRHPAQESVTCPAREVSNGRFCLRRTTTASWCLFWVVPTFSPAARGGGVGGFSLPGGSSGPDG